MALWLLAPGLIAYFSLFIVLLLCLVDPVLQCNPLIRGRVSWLLYFFLVCVMYAMVCFPLGFIGGLFSMILTLPEHLLFYFSQSFLSPA